MTFIPLLRLNSHKACSRQFSTASLCWGFRRRARLDARIEQFGWRKTSPVSENCAHLTTRKLPNRPQQRLSPDEAVKNASEFTHSPDDRHGGERDVTMGDALRLERFQAQPKWEIPVDAVNTPKRAYFDGRHATHRGVCTMSPNHALREANVNSVGLPTRLPQT